MNEKDRIKKLPISNFLSDVLDQLSLTPPKKEQELSEEKEEPKKDK